MCRFVAGERSGEGGLFNGNAMRTLLAGGGIAIGARAAVKPQAEIVENFTSRGTATRCR
jgi:hypothetical protein